MNKSATVAPTVKYMEQTIPPSPSSWIPEGTRLASVLSEEVIEERDLVGLTGENVEVLGTGAFGEVRKVQWRKTPAAAKVVHKELQEKEKQLLLRELELMMRCRHPNIVQFLGYMDTPFVIVMEFCPMGDLRTYWRSRTVSVSHKCRICVDILRGLAYMHNRKPHAIVHRDVKPTNVLLTTSGVAKLTDFGLSRKLEADDSLHGGSFFKYVSPEIKRSRVPSKEDPTLLDMAGSDGPSTEENYDPKPSDVTHMIQKVMVEVGAPKTRTVGNDPGVATFRQATGIVGTAPYMAPEAEGVVYNEKVDIYSAAVTFWELFEQASFQGFLWAMTPAKLRGIIKEMGMTDPRDRPTALEAIDAFEATGLVKPVSLAPSACCMIS